MLQSRDGYRKQESEAYPSRTPVPVSAYGRTAPSLAPGKRGWLSFVLSESFSLEGELLSTCPSASWDRNPPVDRITNTTEH